MEPGHHPSLRQVQIGESGTAAKADGAAKEDAAADESEIYKETDAFEYYPEGHILKHVPSGDEVPLEPLRNGEDYQFYEANQVCVIWAGGENEPEYACDIFNQAAETAKAMESSLRS